MIFGFNTAFAQSGYAIYGMLEDGEKRRIAAKAIALIEIKGSKLIKQTLTDQLGKFRFDIDPKEILPGSYQLLVMETGNKQDKLSWVFEILENKKTYDLGLAQLERSPIMLSEVKIISSAPIYDRKFDKLLVNVENSILATGNSLVEILEKLPGVNIDQGGISVNGKSGILLTIDGRGQYVQKEQVLAIISSMRSESVKQLEIIANPSAKYDSNQGSVINIITKKNYAKSDVHIGSSTPIYPKQRLDGFSYPSFGLGTNLNYKFGKIFSNLSLDINTQKSYNELEYNTLYHMINVRKQSNKLESFDGNLINARWGLSYEVNKRSTINLDLLLIKRTKNRTLTDETLNFYSIPNLPDSTIITNGVFNGKKYGNFSLTAQYSLKLDSSDTKHLDFYYDLTDFKNPYTNTSDNLYSDQSGQPTNSLFFYSARNYKIQQHSIKADYTHTLSKKTKLYAGVKFSRTNTSDTANNHKIDNFGFSQLANGKFDYKESISGAYVMMTTKFKKLEGQVGVRTELTTTNGKTATSGNLADSS